MRNTHQTIVVTGATSGIGRGAAEDLASRGAHLIIQGPEADNQVRPLITDLRRRGAAAVHYVSADFTSLDDVVAAAGKINDLADSIDVLVNNAGVPGADRRVLTEDGNERTFQVNYLALVLLTDLLLPALHPTGKVVNLSSTTHRTTRLHLEDLNLSDSYSPVTAYAQSKLAILTYSIWLARELQDSGMNIVSISPGVISTNLLHSMFGGGGASVSHGARRVVEAIDNYYPSGSYVDDGTMIDPSEEARSREVQESLTNLTREFLAGQPISKTLLGNTPLQNTK